MAKAKFSLKPGTTKKPAKRLSKRALKAEILRQERATPIVLDEADYETWLEHTVLARMERGEQSLDRVKAALKAAAKKAETSEQKSQFELALRELDAALIAFQYTALKANVMYRPSIDGKEALNVLLWPTKVK
jgi:hypothetical protein